MSATKVIHGKFPDETLDFCVQTIGFFDGVHLGHNHLIKQVMSEAHNRDMKSMAITFSAHPQKTLSPQHAPKLLTTLDEKLDLLTKTGLDYVAVLDFTPDMAQMSARDFMQQVLAKQLGGRALVIGYDHHFGRPQGENFQDYQKFGDEMGINVVQATEFTTPENLHFSSSQIRKALQAGDIATANRLLGRPYSIKGTVVHGQAIGHKLGFPTANLDIHPDKLLPKDAAYAVKVHLNGHSHIGMLYIGKRPTFEGLTEQRVEVNIIDFNGEIYGQTLKIEIMHFLRGEQHFDSTEALAAQLQRDLLGVKQLLNS